MSNSEADQFQQAKDQLIADFRAIVIDGEELLRATSGEGNGKASAARAKIEASLRDLRRKLGEVEARVSAQARDAAKATDEMVREHPWKAVGIAATVGLVLGLLMQRR